MMSEQGEKRPSREWVKFGVLALVLLGAIVVVSLARPFIFEYIVPVVMGEGQPAAPAPAAEPQPAPETTVDESYPAPVESSPAVVDDNHAAAAAYPAAEPALDSVTDSAYPADSVNTAVSPITHTVQPGESITSIAETYHTTIDAIAAANNLSNPNHIEVGMVLEIPETE